MAHCILNSNTRAQGLVVDSKLRGGAYMLVSEVLRLGYGIEQLPCPELALEGLFRRPMTKKDYELRGLREVCTKLLRGLVDNSLKPLVRDSIKVTAFIGVAGSPSCGVRYTHIDNPLSRQKGMGIFTEELVKALQRLGIKPLLLEWDFRRPYESTEEVIQVLERVL